MERLYDALDFEDTEDISPLVAWLDSAHFEPFCFVADRQYTEDGDEDDGEELVISFVGRDDGKLEVDSDEHKLEIWGRDTSGMKFKSIPMPPEKEFMVSAKEAFQKKPSKSSRIMRLSKKQKSRRLYHNGLMLSVG
ncbi:hypothetical protein H2248_004375 [Termitomyces sp. 'cryptogamus']|nr:hypothetical protein H2248_004375 [Termitomyces sp. 'cryptogamus']